MKPGPYLRLVVSDTGCGVDPGIADRIFEPFFTTKAAGEGSGLGLAIVHNIVRAHGGAVVFDSLPGKGTRFCIYLPVAADAPRTEPAQPLPASTATNGNGQHILYVDDEEALVFLTTRMLERLGYRVSGFCDAELALRAAVAHDANFDLIITDQSMPGMSGIDLAREVLVTHPKARIVLVSGYLPQSEIDVAFELGIQEVLLKPDTVDELAATVHKILSAQSGLHRTINSQRSITV
jgi:CheY-like chemotaxis protein